jgi:hypothetical protein
VEMLIYTRSHMYSEVLYMAALPSSNLEKHPSRNYHTKLEPAQMPSLEVLPHWDCVTRFEPAVRLPNRDCYPDFNMQ